LDMSLTYRHLGSAMLIVLLICASPNAHSQFTQQHEHAPIGTATVVVAVDLREPTSFRDLPQVGDVFFRKIDVRYADRAKDDYDFGIQGSVAADWRATFGGADDNRAPHLFVVEPGTYAIEKINIGSGPTTIGSGYDPKSHKPQFGSFVVNAGECINLGQLVVRMHWNEGYFYAQVLNNAADVRRFLSESHPNLLSKLQTRILTVTPKFEFQQGGGRL